MVSKRLDRLDACPTTFAAILNCQESRDIFPASLLRLGQLFHFLFHLIGKISDDFLLRLGHVREAGIADGPWFSN